MSDRILICDICGKEKPDFDVKTIMCWWNYGSTYLAGDFYCPFCHCKTPTIIKSSKGTPETGNCSFVDLRKYNEYYFANIHSSVIGIDRTECGENKGYLDHIAKARQIRQQKKFTNRSMGSQPKSLSIIDELKQQREQEELNKFKKQATDKTQYYRFLQKYGSKARAREELEKWKSNGRK
jgi:hypothetical protein